MERFGRRVVVTGLGVVSPLGSSVEEVWSNLLSGVSGISLLEGYGEEYRCRIGGQVRGLDLEKYLSLKEQRRMDPFCWYAVAASDQVMEDSGLKAGENIEPERIGVMISSGIGGLQTITAQDGVLAKEGPRHVSPMTVPMMIGDMASGVVAIRHHLQGPNFGIVSACASGLHAIGEASWVIRRGDADAVMCGGTENGIINLGIAAFGSMKALSANNADPQGASRPFDAERDGFVPGSGAGVLMLEELEHARARGARILAEVTGYGATGDAYHVTAPSSDGSGAARAIGIALQHAGVSPEEVGYVNAHGTSTVMNDAVETKALKLALGEHAYKTPISSTKSMTGHLLGAAGGFESMVCVKAIQTRKAPGTINLHHPDPACDLDYMANESRELPELRHALKLNMGFGGHNAAVLFSRFEG